jgi:predicted aspartyl protease
MKPLRIPFIIIFLIFSSAIYAQDNSRRLDSLLSENDFFSLQKELTTAPQGVDGYMVQYYTTITDNAFNRCQKSAQGIENLLTQYGNQLVDTQKQQLYSTQIYNYLKLYDYKSAGFAVDALLNGKAGKLDSADIISYTNAQYITQTLANVASQTIQKQGDVHIKTKKDKAGLIVLPVVVNTSKKETQYIFDSGANISVMTESEAKKHNLRMLKGKNINIGGATGNKVQSKLGVADSIKIGTITLYNVVFIVFPDKALTFKAFLFRYKIKGIIGYPVMQQLKEVQISKNEIFIPETTTQKSFSNLVLMGYTPTIQAGNKYGDTLNYIFDSGAKASHFFCTYFEKYKADILQNSKMKKVGVAGAGQQKRISVYEFETEEIKTAGISAKLEDVYAYPTEVTAHYKGVYGIIGLDFIQKFKKTTLNFEYMYIAFE